ncbi:oligopeptide/dipeptide ABC transporter ATP-binding protein [Lichenihabitans psoromatis]|uniref:oligopeptide/dipeptide ABC transporter ATP-binding protein n=1 Tax=Lichenihabitans psoromatis TaxID=2528642 RepID=UPI001036B39B|nr:oligopeptide/dipeptide ABC transporter ATP-binding protein [Lichenihabitans psoromatis]
MKRRPGRHTAACQAEGTPPSAIIKPQGCVFHTRCPRHIGPICDTQEPPLLERDLGHAIRCHLPVEALGRAAMFRVTEFRRARGRSRRGLWRCRRRGVRVESIAGLAAVVSLRTLS